MDSTSTLIEVGRFTLDTRTQVLTGPRDYLESVGGAEAAVDIASRSATFRYGAGEPGASPLVLLLVAMQTEYAAFKGSRDFARRVSGGPLGFRDSEARS